MEIRELLFKLAKIGIIAVLLTPFIMGPFGLNMSEYPKGVFFRSLIEAVFAVYLFLILLKPSFIPKKSFLFLSVIIFDAIMIISSLFGVNFFRSFFGDMQRGEGIILHLHLLAFFVMLIGLFQEKKDWLWLLKISAVFSGIQALAGVFQYLGIYKFYNVSVGRLAGTFSNPDLFGPFMGLSFFLTAFVYFCEKSKRLKKLWIFLMCLDFFGIVFSGTRGCWVGFAVGIACIYLVNYNNLHYKKKIFSLLIILGVLVLALFAPFAIKGTFLEKTFLGSRILSIFNIDLQSRTSVWKVSLDASKDRPILGWGVESFSYVHDKYVKKDYLSGIYFDRQHNKILEILQYSGILGLLAYLLIFLALFRLIFKYSRLWDGYNGKKGIFLGSIIFAFFVSGFVQNIVGFDHIGTYILFFLMAGFLNNNFSAYKKPAGSDKPLSAEKVILAVSVFIFAFYTIYQANIKPTLAAMNFNESIKYESADISRALAGYRQGIIQGTIYDYDMIAAYADRIIFLLENNYGQNAGELAVKQLLQVKPALYGAIERRDIRPANAHEFLMRIDEWAHIVRKDPSYLDDMQKDVDRAMAFNPVVSSFWQLSGEMKILRGGDDEGEKDIKKGCKLDTAACGGKKSESYRLIGIAYFKKGDIKKTLESFESALSTDFDSRKNGKSDVLNNARHLVDSVAVMHYRYYTDYESAKKVYLRAIEAYPEAEAYFSSHLDYITADWKKNR